MPPAGFEPAMPECERPQTDAIERAPNSGTLYVCAKLYFCSGGAFILTVLPPVVDPDTEVKSRGRVTNAEFYHSARPDVRVRICF